jgi:hypothetical protein
MALIGQTYSIPEIHLDGLKDKLDKIKRKSKKLGLDVVEYEIGSLPVDKPFYRDPDGRERPFGEKEAAHHLKPTFYRRYFTVTVYGKPPTLAGWTFVATLQHLVDDSGSPMNVLRIVPGFVDQLPAKYRTSTPACDHCKLARKRKDTYVVRNEETGEWKQIGSTCLDDFLGGADPQDIARSLEWIFQALADAQESEGGAGGGSDRGAALWPLSQFLTWTASVIRINGWLSRGKARDMGGTATADVVDYLFTSKSREAEEARVEYAPTEADEKTAEETIAYVRETLAEKGDERDDYEHNLYVAMTQPAVAARLSGIVASAIPFYTRAIGRKIEAEHAKASEHFGVVGERGYFKVSVVTVIPIESMYGTSYLHKMLTPEGNMATWFASINPRVEIGEERVVVATVKGHEDYKGAKQTALSRVKFLADDEVLALEEKTAKKAAREAKKSAKNAPEFFMLHPGGVSDLGDYDACDWLYSDMLDVQYNLKRLQEFVASGEKADDDIDGMINETTEILRSIHEMAAGTKDREAIAAYNDALEELRQIRAHLA